MSSENVRLSCILFMVCEPLAGLLQAYLRMVGIKREAIPFESKLLPAVLLLLRIYFPKITVTVTVLKFG